ncbi:NADH-dependent flavin oxidoreductase [Paenibacillus sp. A3]|uniref:NADH-dependent flavin oxidoreductase n=1 Tax=Paenibacillus sp. A3 TaxID=1337054 RepID=UPI0006D5873D|nr:NADH-dependent flavin oxidoreductase [Paenibacillus sp. A3]KPV55843.1 NADH-dependent flavin oxidoreductase [Paenibacillus sp. A3]
MMKSVQPMLEPFTLPNGIDLKNRIVMAPMTHSASQPDGAVSDAEIKYYARRANGVGMLITAAAGVTASGSFPGTALVDRDELIPGLSRLASAIKSEGAKAVLQIVHGGRKCFPGGDLVSASAIPEEKEGAAVPRELTDSEITGIIRAFGEATRRAIEAGFDGVELHGANGFLIHQFFSPHSNRRTDRWGGTLEKRMTFPLELIGEVQRVVREHAKEPFIVGYRLSPEEPETPGITMADTLTFVEVLAGQGLDYLHISLNDFRSIPRRGADDSRTRLELIQELVGTRVPVIGVGAIRTAQDAAQALELGIPLIAVGRALIIEPDWVAKVAQGREQELRMTLSKNDQESLAIPDSLWRMILAVPGWFPVEAEA